MHAHRHLANIIRQIGEPSRFPGRFMSQVEMTADDVAIEAARKRSAILQHHAQLAPDGLHVEATQIMAVVVDRPLLWALEAE